MYCRTCGKEVYEQAVMCTACGVPPRKGRHFCQFCGAKTIAIADVCTQCGVRLVSGEGKQWVVALLLSIFLGSFGIDRFYMGRIVSGIMKLLLFVLLFISPVFFIGNTLWWLIDLILIAANKLKDADGNYLQK